MPGLPVNAPTDALLTMAPPPWRSICRSSCFMQLQTPRRLTPMTRSHSSRVLSAVGAMRAMTPALLNAASSRPNSDTARSTIASTWASSATSHRTAIALWPAATSSAAAAFTASSLKSARTTAAPASANALAVASPMPAAAPVTSAALPLKSSVFAISGRLSCSLRLRRIRPSLKLESHFHAPRPNRSRQPLRVLDSPEPGVAVGGLEALVEEHQRISPPEHEVTVPNRHGVRGIGRERRGKPRELLVAVQLAHVERQREHRQELGRRRVVVERGRKRLPADRDFHFLALRFATRLLAVDGRLGSGGLLRARRIAARKPDQHANREVNDATPVLIHGDFLIIVSKLLRIIIFDYFRLTVKNCVSLSKGMRFTRS